MTLSLGIILPALMRFAQRAAQLQSIEFRQAQIEHDDVVGAIERHARRVPLAAEQHRQHFGAVFVVVDDKDAERLQAHTRPREGCDDSTPLAPRRPTRRT